MKSLGSFSSRTVHVSRPIRLDWEANRRQEKECDQQIFRVTLHGSLGTQQVLWHQTPRICRTDRNGRNVLLFSVQGGWGTELIPITDSWSKEFLFIWCLKWETKLFLIFGNCAVVKNLNKFQPLQLSFFHLWNEKMPVPGVYILALNEKNACRALNICLAHSK